MLGLLAPLKGVPYYSIELRTWLPADFDRARKVAENSA